MKKKLLSIIEFAQLADRSRQAIYQHIDTGLIQVTLEDGKKRINPNLKKNRSYLESCKGVIPPQRATKQEKKTNKKPSSSKKQTKSAEEIEDESDIPEFLKNLADAGDITFEQALSLEKNDLQKIEIYEKIKKLKQERTLKRGDYMSVYQVRHTMNKIYSIHEQQLKQIKSRVIPDLAGLMGCTEDGVKLESEARLDEEIHDVLKSIKYEIDKFVSGHGN